MLSSHVMSCLILMYFLDGDRRKTETENGDGDLSFVSSIQGKVPGALKATRHVVHWLAGGRPSLNDKYTIPVQSSPAM